MLKETRMFWVKRFKLVPDSFPSGDELLSTGSLSAWITAIISKHHLHQERLSTIMRTVSNELEDRRVDGWSTCEQGGDGGRGFNKNNLQQDEGGQDYQQVICLPVFVRTCEDMDRGQGIQGTSYQMTDTDSARTITTSTCQSPPTPILNQVWQVLVFQTTTN